MRDIWRLIRVWKRMTLVSIQVSFANPLGATFFIVAKTVRFLFFFGTILIVVGRVGGIGGYSSRDVILVFCIFTLIDTIAQLLFREVYRFRPRVISGDFDLDLLKPTPSIFRPLLGGADGLDLVMLGLYILAVGWYVASQGLLQHLPSALVLIFNAVLISAAFHILVLSLGVLTTQVDSAIMLYRDLWNLGRFPQPVYSGIVGIMTSTILPLTIMIMVPLHALLGQVSLTDVLRSSLLALGAVSASLFLWRLSLRHYTGAGS